jgi:hypothetical protein
MGRRSARAYANICSMPPVADRPSQHPRDVAVRAALRDAALLASFVENRLQASYRGPERAEYVRVLTGFVSDLGGSIEEGPSELVATIGERRISVAF